MARVLEKEATFSTAVTAVVTTTELACVSVSVPITTETCRVIVRGSALMTTGASSTGVTCRFRRGTGITGAVVGPETAQPVKIAAGGTEAFEGYYIDVPPARSARAIYTLTVQQDAATGNGSLLQAAIEAEVLNG